MIVKVTSPVSGGLGTLGLLTASWLSRQARGVALLLIGRTGRPSSAAAGDAALQSLMHAHYAVTFARCDTSSQAEMDDLMLPSTSGPLLVRRLPSYTLSHEMSSKLLVEAIIEL